MTYELQDERYLKDLSTDALPASACPIIDIIDKHDYHDLPQLVSYVLDRFSHGNMVIVQNFSTDHASLNEQDLSTVLGIALSSKAEVHCRSIHMFNSYHHFLILKSCGTPSNHR